MKNKKKQAIKQERINKIINLTQKYAEDWSAQHEELTLKIIEAFYDTELGDGIGFYEADARDDHSPDWQTWRNKDERIYWENMFALKFEKPYPQRFRPHSAFSFMDGLGRRFALPCYLLWELQGDDFSLDWYLSNPFYTENLPLNLQQQNVLYEFVQMMTERACHQDWKVEDWQQVHEHLSEKFEYFVIDKT